jgi:iron uptake system component EfeO
VLPRALRRLLAPAVVLATGIALTACSTARSGGSGAGIAVSASDSGCRLSSSSTTSGPATFTVTNTGTRSTEFELLDEHGVRTIGEVENLGPGLTRTLSVQLEAGRYTSLCKPGMSGDGVGRATLTVEGADDAAATQQPTGTTAASKAYLASVRTEARTLLAGTRTFAAAYAAGHTATAKALYAPTRASYERIEPVAEAFGTLDAALDAREADVPAGTRWTGWHRIEKDLWHPSAAANGGAASPPLTAAGRAAQAKTLVSLTEQLVAKVDTPSFVLTTDTISNGAIGLLDEIAATKITGEEEVWSHTDLSDFRANVDGAEQAYAGVRGLAKQKDLTLVTTLDARFAALDALLAHYGSVQKGFVPYTTLSTAEVKTLSDDVNALAEPLSRLTATVLR